MAGIKFATSAPADTAIKTAYRHAQNLGFSVEQTSELRIRVTQGNFALSLVVGAFICYCDFQLAVREYDEDNEVTLEWSSPWWTGFIGVGRTKRAAKELMDAIGDALEEKKFKVFDDKEY